MAFGGSPVETGLGLVQNWGVREAVRLTPKTEDTLGISVNASRIGLTRLQSRLLRSRERGAPLDQDLP